MKKVRYGSLLLGFFLLLLSFVGCGEVVPPPDGVVSQTDTYTIERIGGLCYLTFAEGDEPRKWEQGNGCVVETGSFTFSSLDEMFQAFTKGPLDFHALQMIRTFNVCDDNGRYSVIDPYFLKIPKLPEEYLISGLTVNGLECSFSIKNGKARGAFQFLLEERYRQAVAGFDTFAEKYRKTFPRATVTELESDERGAAVYDVHDGNYTYRFKFYAVSDGSVEVFVEEKYVLWESRHFYGTSETVPLSVTGYSFSGEDYFKFFVSHPEERPSEKWLLSFGVTLYEPPESAISKK